MDVDYYPLTGDELKVYFTSEIRKLLESKDSPLSRQNVVWGRPSAVIHTEWMSWNFEKQYGLDVRVGEMNDNDGVVTGEAFLDLVMQTWQIAADGWPDLGLAVSYFNPTFKIQITISGQAAKLKPGQQPEDVKSLDPEQFPLNSKELELLSPVSADGREGLLYPDKIRAELGLPIPGPGAAA